MFSRFIIVCITLIMLSSCLNQDQNLEKNIEIHLFLLEETNRLKLKDFILDKYGEELYRDDISALFLNCYEYLDTISNELLIQSGGYNRDNGLLINPNDQDISFELINRYEMYSKLNSYKDDLELLIEEEHYFKNEFNDILYNIDSDFFRKKSKEIKAKEFYYILLIVQYKILVLELEYIEINLRNS